MPLFFFFVSLVYKKKRNKKNAGGRVMITGDATPFVCGESCVWLCALKKPPGPAHPPHILAGRLPPNGSRLSKESRPPLGMCVLHLEGGAESLAAVLRF